MKPGILKHICTSTAKGTVKHPVDRAELRAEWGIVGDAHAGKWHRQVSLLDEADIGRMLDRGLTLAPGVFGENLAVAGLDLAALGVGSELAISGVRLRVTQIGKVCHDRCVIYDLSGDCIMPRLGVFLQVVTSGEIAPGATVTVEKIVPRQTIQAAVVTVSDRCAAGVGDDSAGPASAKLLESALGAHIAWTGIVPDETDDITVALKELCDRNYDLVVTTGGTGFATRDVTPEATRRVIEREAPGLAETMRAQSLEKTPHAMLQRGVCGIRRGTLIINLPGSERGAVENLECILPALTHAVRQLRGERDHSEEPA